MTVAEFLDRYAGRKLDMDSLSSYEQWALPFFHQQDVVKEPHLQMTLQLDITEALAYYRAEVKGMPGATFTAYLIWHLSQTTSRHPCFRYRCIEGEWYVLDNLPVFTPIAIGGDARFSETLLENVIPSTLAEFFPYYQGQLTKGRSREDFQPLSNLEWGGALFVGNLPNLQFTGFTLHMSAFHMGRPYFYFGKRYTQQERDFIPMLITFDHANLDPFVLSSFMEDFEGSIAGKEISVK
ncbi:MAG: CatA-like O-acetyltransferase [Bacteroidota bacterium]